MNLLKSLAAVSSITMLSRVLGFVRDTILARIFGAGLATDAFFVAFKLPNLLRRIFAEGAFSQAFVPILAEYKNQQGEEATRTFIAYVSGLLTLVLALVTALGILAAPWVIWVTAPGFADTPEKFALTTDLLRVTFPYILLISLSSLAGAILNTWNRFSVPAFVPTLLNVAMIGFALFLTPYFDPPVMVLGWAVLAGGLLQLLYQLPHLRKIGMLVLPRLNLRDSGVWRVMKLMLPAILGVSVSQISLIINTIFASFLAAGSVSWMYYADRLMELPSGVLGVALGTILLPMLAGLRQASPGSRLAVFELQPARLEQQAANDTVDLFFHTREGAPPGLHQRLLFRERYVLAGRAEHSALRPGLSLETFCQLEHVIVSPDGGGFSAATDIALANLGLMRRVVLSVPHFLFMLETLRNSDLVAVQPERLVRGQSGLVVVEPPLAVAGFEMLMLWHERWHRDPAHQWLRQFIVNSLEEQTC